MPSITQEPTVGIVVSLLLFPLGGDARPTTTSTSSEGSKEERSGLGISGVGFSHRGVRYFCLSSG